MIKHQKSNALLQTFERKGPGEEVSHYCPGCGHGVIHKLIAEALADFDLTDKAVFMAPVGCSVFIYYYFDSAAIQCPHGRAPAVGSAVKRVHEDSIVISYQGDGDLAGIGSAEIIHAANRGENMSVIFINNAIYGMTGGQMAPTTLLGQKTKTTPFGRDIGTDGAPIKMAEIINTMEAPVFIERTSLSTPSGVMKARKAIRKAILNQKEKKGFSFVEILSPCPINWKMNPVEARKWLKENLENYYPVKNFRDRDVEEKKRYRRYPFASNQELLNILGINVDIDERVNKTKTLPEIIERVKFAGFGGQGVMSVGILLANCAVKKGYETSWLPSYGPEMRGGSANASVTISTNIIGTPVVDNPDTLVAMSLPALDTFEDSVNKGGIILVNSSLIDRKVRRSDVKAFYIPATEMATNIGLAATAPVIILTIYAKITGIISIEDIKMILPQSLKNTKYIDINMKAIEKGEEFFEKELKNKLF